MKEIKIHRDKIVEKFSSYHHICKYLKIDTTQARTVNKEKHCSLSVYHLSIWSTTVNAKFS